MLLIDLIGIILTSTVVSALISFLFRIWFEKRLKHHFDSQIEKLRQSYRIELEEVKNSLIIDADTTRRLVERRLNLYPKMVELVYRTRNIAREITKSFGSSLVLAEELSAREVELEENLYAYRMDLERDGFFDSVHAYKNAVKTFLVLIKEANYQKDKEDKAEVEVIWKELNESYADIESKYKPLVKSISTHISSTELS